METEAAVRSNRHADARRRPNLWIVLAILLILAVALLIFEFYIRRNVEGAGHLQENAEVLDTRCYSAAQN